MGLDTTHDAWHGSYGSFNSWRTWLAQQIGIPLELMQGFYYDGNGYGTNMFTLLEHKFPQGDEIEMSSIRRFKQILPLKWEAFKPSPLHILLNHSDCDGHITWKNCGKIAKELKKILSTIDMKSNDYMYKKTEDFINGCELAFNEKENLEFH